MLCKIDKNKIISFTKFTLSKLLRSEKGDVCSNTDSNTFNLIFELRPLVESHDYIAQSVIYGSRPRRSFCRVSRRCLFAASYRLLL